MGKLQLIPDEFEITKSEAEEIESAFKPMVEMLKQLEIEYNEIIKKEINEETVKEAYELRKREYIY